jgi:hypothetical protein
MSLLMLLVACVQEDELVASTMLTEASPHLMCGEAPTPLAVDEVAPDGRTPGEVVAPFVGTYEAPLVYRDDSATDLTFTLTLGTAAWVTWTPPAEDPAMTCPEEGMLLRFDATFQSADGVFDEAFSEDRAAAETDGASLYFGPYLPMASLGGSFTYPGADTLSLAINVGPDLFVGEAIAIVPPDGECGIAAFNTDLMTGCAP